MPIKRTRTTSTSAESNSASKSARGRGRPLSASQTLNTYGKREQEHVAADTEEDLMQIDKSRSANVESPQSSPRLGIQDSQDSQMDFLQRSLDRVNVRDSRDSFMPPRTPRYRSALGRETSDEDDKELPPNVGRENIPGYAQGLDEVTIVKVACGGNITLALTDDDDEDNAQQRIGQKVTTPTKINNFVPCKFIATGDYHSIAVSRDGKLYSWGFGEPFGSGDEEKKDPYLLSGERLAGRSILAIGGGSQHT
ncbi:15697_t:CDS:2, partial [Racocetra persica]